MADSLDDVIVRAARAAAPVFTREKWTWARLSGPPGERDLEEQLYQLAEWLLADVENVSVASGQLIAERRDNTSIRFSLVLGEWGAE